MIIINYHIFLIKYILSQEDKFLTIFTNGLIYWLLVVNLNSIFCTNIQSSRLAKMKKYIPYLSLLENLQGRSSWSKRFQLYSTSYDFCEIVKVKFWAILRKSDILSKKCLSEVKI